MKDFFKKLLDLWIEFGKLLNKIVSPVALTIIYTVAFGISSLVSRISGNDLLHKKFTGPSYWKEIEHKKEDMKLEDYARQF